MRTLILAAVLVSTVVFAGEPVAMFIPQSINLEPPQVESFGVVCASTYARVSESQVIAPSQARAAIGENGSLSDAAKALQVKEWVELSLVDLSSTRARGRLLITAVRRGVDGAELYRADFTADSIDDAPQVCERIALSLTQKLTPRQTLNRNNVTAAEARMSSTPNRIGSERVVGVKTSFSAALSSGGELNPLGSLAFNVRLEQERYFIEFGAGALIPAVLSGSNVSYGGLTAELGASYYLSAGDVSPYVGGGVQPRLVFGGSFMNLAPYAQFGMMFMRESSTRLYLDARLSQNILPVSGGFGTTSGLYPTELTAAVGVGW